MCSIALASFNIDFLEIAYLIIKLLCTLKVGFHICINIFLYFLDEFQLMFRLFIGLKIWFFRICSFKKYKKKLYIFALIQQFFDNTAKMFGEDEENDHQQQFVVPPLKQLQFTIDPSQKVSCTTLYIGFYGVSSLFVSTLVDTKTPIARINFQKAKQKSLASVYADEQKTNVFVVFNEQFQKMREIHFAAFIQKNFQFQSLVIFTSIAKNMLQKQDGLPLKCLQTSWGLDLHAPKYQQGLTGPQADLLQWAEINGKNAICFVGIYSDYEVNKQIIQNIFGQLNKIFLPFDKQYDISKQIKAYNMAKYANKLYL